MVASGMERYYVNDLQYKSLNEKIEIYRRYRSFYNSTALSFGYGWFSNLDTRIIIGRKPLIKETEILFARLAQETDDLALDAGNQVAIAEQAHADAAKYAQEAQERWSNINTLVAELEGQVLYVQQCAVAADEYAIQAECFAAQAGTGPALQSAAEAREAANGASAYAQQAAQRLAQARETQSQAQSGVAQAWLNANGAAQAVAAAKASLTEIQAIAKDMHELADVAAAEARAEEAMFPDDPYPADPSVYFGRGYIKYYDQDGVPTLLERQADGGYLPLSDGGRLPDRIEETGGGFRLTTKHQVVHEFITNGKGISLLSTITDPNGNAITYAYDGDFIVSITDQVERKTVITRTSDGKVREIVDPLGRKRLYEYQNGQLVSSTDAAGNKTRYEYDGQNRLVSVINAQGHGNRIYYDEQGRVVKEVDFDGYAHEFVYSPESRMTRMVDPSGNEHVFHYNESNRTTRHVYPDGSAEDSVYDEKGNLIAQTDEKGYTTNYTYNEFNDATSISYPIGGTRYISYDQSFNKISRVVDQEGRATLFDYDGSGNLVRVAKADGAEVRMSYNSLGLVESYTDENGHATRFEYDGYGNPAAQIFPDGSRKQFTADMLGRVTQVVDENGNATRVGYNGLDKITSVINAVGGTTKFAYDALGNLIRVTDAEDHVTHFEYTKRDKVAAVTDPEGNATRYAYDALNNPARVDLPNGTGFEYAHDVRGRLTEITSLPTGKRTRFSYDAVGNRTATTDANGNTKTLEYDALRRVTTEIDALGHVTRFDYDAVGNLVALIDASGQRRTFDHDALNRKIRETDPLGNAIAFEYDPAGNLAARQNPDGSTINLAYDQRNRLVRKSFSDGTQHSYAYDAAGNIIEAKAPGLREVRTYNTLNLLASASVEPFGKTLCYEYDSLGRRVRMIDPEAGEHVYAYDGRGKLVSYAEPNGTRTEFSYDSLGRQIEVINPGGLYSRYDYNQDNWLSTIVNEGTGGVHSSFAYTYDAVGNRLSVADETGGVTSYEYDAIYRLTGAEYAANAVKQHGKPEQDKNLHDPWDDDILSPAKSFEQFEYDAVGNRVRLRDDYGTTNYTYNTANQLLRAGNVRYEYDVNGNRVAKQDSKGRTAYAYTVDNLLARVDAPNGDSTVYNYDAFGRRVLKDYISYLAEGPGAIHAGPENSWGLDVPGGYPYGRRVYLYDGLEVVQELAGPHLEHVTAYYRAGESIIASQGYTAQLGGEPRYTHRPEGRQLYYAYDALGSVASLANYAGQERERYQYLAFGSLVVGDVTANAHTFTGREFDPESGLYHFHFRQYDADNGVWTAADPASIATGYNHYQYADNNPICNIDILGLWSVYGGVSADVSVVASHGVAATGMYDLDDDKFSGDLGTTGGLGLHAGASVNIGAINENKMTEHTATVTADFGVGSISVHFNQQGGIIGGGLSLGIGTPGMTATTSESWGSGSSSTSASGKGK